MRARGVGQTFQSVALAGRQAGKPSPQVAPAIGDRFGGRSYPTPGIDQPPGTALTTAISMCV